MAASKVECMCALSLRRFTNFHSSLIGVHWYYIPVGLAVLKGAGAILLYLFCCKVYKHSDSSPTLLRGYLCLAKDQVYEVHG